MDFIRVLPLLTEFGKQLPKDCQYINSRNGLLCICFTLAADTN